MASKKKQFVCPECSTPLNMESFTDEDLRLGATAQCPNQQCLVLISIHRRRIKGVFRSGDDIRITATQY